MFDNRRDYTSWIITQIPPRKWHCKDGTKLLFETTRINSHFLLYFNTLVCDPWPMLFSEYRRHLALKPTTKLHPWFLQSYFILEQIPARGKHHLLTKDHSENHDILSKSHTIDLEVFKPIFSILATENSII